MTTPSNLPVQSEAMPMEAAPVPVPSRPARTKRFIAGAGIGYAYQALVMIVGLWFTPFLLRHLGQHDFGLWAVGTQILGYLVLLDMGVFALLPRETGNALGLAQGRPETAQISSLIAKVIRIVMIQMPLVVLAAAVTWYFLPAAWQALRPPLAVMLVVFVVLFPFQILQGILSGLQDLAFLGLIRMLSWTITTAVSLALVFRGVGLYSLAIGWGMGEVVSIFCFVWRTRSRFPWVLPKSIFAATWQESRIYLRRSMWVTVSRAASILLNGSDVLIIGKVLGPLAVVPYVCTGKLISVLSNQPQMLMDLALPGMSEMRYSESRERIQQASTALSQIMLLFSGALVCAVLVLNRSFVNWWVGANQYGGFRLTAFIMTLVVLRHWSRTLINTIFCFGYERWISYVGLVDGVVTVVSSVVIVHFYGPLGAPVGGIIGVCLVSLPANLWALSRELNTSVARLLVPIRGWALRLALLVLLAAFLQRSFFWHSFPVMAVIGATSLLLYLVFMFPVMLSPPCSVYIKPLLHNLRVRIRTLITGKSTVHVTTASPQ
ncbi:MAG TPA: oligosaccharide flippase family protein [Candidatus Angelobacter sp.]|nr:oligosaccharide flippase family protein [Candidatus Angelobacter sp.]